MGDNGRERLRCGAILLFAVVLLCACGGGGGGGGGGGSAPPQSITYQGNTAQATLTAANAKRFFDLVFGTATENNLAPLGAVVVETDTQAADVFDLGRRLRPYAQKGVANRAANRSVTGLVVNENDPCLISGSVSLKGTLDDNTGLGDLTARFQNCNDGDGVLNGLVVFHIRGFDGVNITDLLSEITLFHLTNGPTDMSTSGAIESLSNPATNVSIDTLDTVNRDNTNGRFSKAENLVRTANANLLTMSGRVFDSVEGFVEASTTSPLRFLIPSDLFPFQGGPLVLTGAGNTSLVITPLSFTMVQLDIATNGTVDLTARIAWDSTTPPVFANSVAGIQARIDAAAAGDTILVDPGVYDGTIDFHGKDVVLKSRDGPANTILSNRSGGRVVQIGPGGAVKGFTITGSLPPPVPDPPGTESSIPGGGIQVIGEGSVIAGNIFERNFTPAGSFGGSAISGGSPTIERNIFRNNAGSDAPSYGAVSGISGSLITNNIFENNLGPGIFSFADGLRVINNTFVGNPWGILIYRRVTTSSPQIFRNNILFQNGTGFAAQFETDAENPVWENNLVFGNTTNYQGTSDQTGINGNISVDPLFVNSVSGDYHLQFGSPAIDTGSAVDAPTVDFDGTARPIDGDGNGSAIVDIGAFEAAAPP